LGDLALDTALVPLASHGESHSFGAELSRDWEIWGPNGGYLAALALRAAGACAAIQRPVAFYCHFLSVARFAPVELRVHALRRGRRAEAWQVSLEQDGRAIVHAPFVDAGRLLILLDTMNWPAASRAHPLGKFQAPSLDVAAWFHRPAGGEAWLLSDHTAGIAEGGLIGSTGRVWSAGGRLLASGGTQLLCTPVGDA
jgi:acyl-CoA thioesterase